MKSNLTIITTKLDVGYMAKFKEFPEIMCWSKKKKGLITKLIHALTEYEEAFPNRIETILTKLSEGDAK